MTILTIQYVQKQRIYRLPQYNPDLNWLTNVHTIFIEIFLYIYSLNQTYLYKMILWCIWFKTFTWRIVSFDIASVYWIISTYNIQYQII